MNEHLMSPMTLGNLALPNRVWMAPLTRARTEQDHIPTALMAEHYAQRASAGLIIAEATMAMEHCSAFVSEPGIYSPEQVEGWAKVVKAVHAKGGRIFLQIWHGGRACHPVLNSGKEPVSASAIAITNDEVHTPKGKLPYSIPRALMDGEIAHIVSGFKIAAENAKRAGFDGIEVHGANGYLLDQFLRDGSNQRDGKYGGSIEHRARLLLEVLDAVIEVWGAQRVGLRLSPLNSFNSMKDSNPVALMSWLCQALNTYNLAYLHMMRADFLGEQQGDIMEVVQQYYQGTVVGNMGYSAEEADQAIAKKQLDAVAFGVPFIANPDLPKRFAEGLTLNTANPDTFYTPGAEGYTDYPFVDDALS